jgi:tetratricopeptide (TPR) repeat protein
MQYDIGISACIPFVVDDAELIASAGQAGKVHPDVAAEMLAICAQQFEDTAQSVESFPVMAINPTTLLRHAADWYAMAALLAPGSSVHTINQSRTLLSIYRRTGIRSGLDAALAIAYRVDSASLKGLEAFSANHQLALVFHSAFVATGDADLIAEAVKHSRMAVTYARGFGGDEHVAVAQATLGRLLIESYEESYAQDRLGEAVSLLRDASGRRPNMAGILRDLAVALGKLGSVTENIELLEEAIERGLDAYEASGEVFMLPLHGLDKAITPEWEGVRHFAFAATRASQLRLDLASFYMALHRISPAPGQLDHAWDQVAGLNPPVPLEQVRAHVARAHIVRAYKDSTGSLDRAIEQTQAALEIFKDEQERLAADSRRLRDLAQTLDGLIGDLAALKALQGDPEAAIRLLEAPRTWLPSPDSAFSPDSATSDIKVVWIVASAWETLVLDEYQGVLSSIPITAQDIRRAGVNLISSVGQHGIFAGGAAEAVMNLVGLASQVARGFPSASRILIVPLGISSILPFAAATVESGPLLDKCAITLAPSLRWAMACRRERPTGGSVGVFHPGNMALSELALADEVDMFESALGGEVLWRPTTAEVMEAITPPPAILHVSCHGHYNHAYPLRSHLELQDRWTLDEALALRSSAWLVNLSACESGVPDIGSSEQAISFPTAFIQAGASHILGTLWPVSNAYAIEVNRHFYAFISSGLHPSVALQSTLQMLNRASSSRVGGILPGSARGVTPIAPPLEQNRSHPVWWAAFAHFGSPW